MPEDIRYIHLEEYMNLMDGLRCGYVSDEGSGPEIGDKIPFFVAVPNYVAKHKP